MSIDGKFTLAGKTALITGGGTGSPRDVMAIADAGANVMSARRIDLLKRRRSWCAPWALPSPSPPTLPCPSKSTA
jgi:hypothetical protein